MNSICPTCDRTIVDECEQCEECGQSTCMDCVSDDPSYFAIDVDEALIEDGNMMCGACWEDYANLNDKPQ